jgi:hypothetical protein
LQNHAAQTDFGNFIVIPNLHLLYLFSPFLTSYFLGDGNRLDAYIYDYLMKRELYETAKAFHDEGAVETDVGKILISAF